MTDPQMSTLDTGTRVERPRWGTTIRSSSGPASCNTPGGGGVRTRVGWTDRLKGREGANRHEKWTEPQSRGHSRTLAAIRESCGDARSPGLPVADEQAGSVIKVGKGRSRDRGEAQLTLHMQLGPPAVTLNKDGGAQEGRTAQSPDEGAEHE